MSIIAGIDYSMRSPAVCVIDTNNLSFSECKFLAVPIFPKKGLANHYGNIELRPNPGADCGDVLRFDYLAKQIVGFCEDHDVERVIIEDYAYAGSGRVFNLAENVGVLKHTLYHADIPFDVVAPTSVKKFATGKGNAQKWDMYDQFARDTGVDLLTVFGFKKLKKIQSPIDDVIDAYYIVQQFANNK